MTNSLAYNARCYTEDSFPKYTNITTKLKHKLFTKVIREPTEEAWASLGKESN
jgi:hypothetical protein